MPIVSRTWVVTLCFLCVLASGPVASVYEPSNSVLGINWPLSPHNYLLQPVFCFRIAIYCVLFCHIAVIIHSIIPLFAISVHVYIVWVTSGFCATLYILLVLTPCWCFFTWLQIQHSESWAIVLQFCVHFYCDCVWFALSLLTTLVPYLACHTFVSVLFCYCWLCLHAVSVLVWHSTGGCATV